jgi:hypothetical protein
VPDLSAFLPPLFGAVAGVLLKYVYDRISERVRFKRELEDNNHIDVSGEWYAAWHTSVDGKPLVNTEHLHMKQKGKTLRVWNSERSPENPKGGYLWEGQFQFLQARNVMGWYFPRAEESNGSKGILYMTYLSPRRQFFGKWVGTAYDGELVTGCVVIAKDRTRAREDLEAFIAKHPETNQLISYAGVGGGGKLPEISG